MTIPLHGKIKHVLTMPRFLKDFIKNDLIHQPYPPQKILVWSIPHVFDIQSFHPHIISHFAILESPG